MADFINRLERACARAEYEFPLLAAPDGTVAVRFTDLRQLLSRLASVDTLPKGGDAKLGSVRSKGSAVGEAETPNLTPHPKGQTRSNKSRPVT